MVIITNDKLFQGLDEDRSGSIDVDELLMFLQKWNVTVPRQKMAQFMAKYDKDGDGDIDYNEFVSELMPKES